MIIADEGPALALSRRDGAILAVDDAFAAFLATPADDLRRSSFFSLTYPPDMPASLDALRRLADTGRSVSLRKRYIRGDGVVVWAEVRISLLHGAEGERFHAVVCTPAQAPANDDGLTERVVYC